MCTFCDCSWPGGYAMPERQAREIGISEDVRIARDRRRNSAIKRVGRLLYYKPSPAEAIAAALWRQIRGRRW